MPTAVVAGGAGFIGSHLCDRLLSQGNNVIAIDNFITGDKQNIAHLEGNKSFKFIQHDVSMPITIDGPVDMVFNMASPASPVDYLKFPIETLKVGAYGTHNLLELARVKNARFLQASTSEVYGDPLVHPQPETYWGHVNSIGPRSVYDEAKRFGEAIIMAYNRQYGVKTRIVRIFNTYGPRMRAEDGRVVSNFIVQSLKGKALTVFGQGQQTRSFQYVDDLIDGIMLLIASDFSDPVNIGNPEEYTVLQLAQMVKEMTASASEIKNLPLPQDDPKQRRPDIARAKQVLGWSPKVPVKVGISKTIEYFRSLQKQGKI